MTRRSPRSGRRAGREGGAMTLETRVAATQGPTPDGTADGTPDGAPATPGTAPDRTPDRTPDGTLDGALDGALATLGDALGEAERMAQGLLDEIDGVRAALGVARMRAALLAGRRGCDTATQIPLRDIAPSGAPHGWRIDGRDPQLLVPALADAPCARIRFRARLDAPVAEGVWQLFMDFGDGFAEADSVWAPVTGDRIEVDMITPLRAAAGPFRLDPLDQPCDMIIDAFEITPLSAARARALMAARRIREAAAQGDLGRHARRITGALLRGRTKPLREVFDPPGLRGAGYDAWVAARRVTPALRRSFERKAAGFALQPTFSILTPTYDAPLPFLEKAVDSVIAQTWARWELILVDDGSPNQAALRPELERIAAKDPRIRLRLLERNQGIAGATNVALAEATGAFIALMDHDDALAPHALHAMADMINRRPDVDWIYSDEDKIDTEDRRFGPFFKPDWSPAYFLSCMYTCHLGVYRRALVEQVGGFRSAFDFAQDYDLALRVSAATDRVAHVPDILYHWRTLPRSTAGGAEAKPEAERRARAAVQDRLDAGAWPGEALPSGRPGVHRPRFAIRGAPLASLAILSAGKRNLSGDGWFVLDLVRSIRAVTTYRAIEIVIADNGDFEPALTAALAPLGVRQATYRAETFNLPDKMNFLVDQTRGDYVVLLNDDMTVVTPEWVEEMLMWAQQPDVAAVGAKLLFPDGKLQHAGVTMLGQGPSHLYYLHPGDEVGHGGCTAVAREMSGVTGACLMTRRADYIAAGGFDPAFRINFNDVDFCLRLRAHTGGRIVWTPWAVLRHYESVSRDPAPPRELPMILDRWRAVFGRDPYYNIHLSQTSNNHDVTRSPRPLEADYGL